MDAIKAFFDVLVSIYSLPINLLRPGYLGDDAHPWLALFWGLLIYGITLVGGDWLYETLVSRHRCKRPYKVSLQKKHHAR